VDGALAYQHGNRDVAEERLHEALRKNPNLIMPREMLGDLYKQQGDFQRAVQEYEGLARLDRYSDAAFRKLGICYQLLSRLREATLSYARAMKLNARDWESSMNLGLVFVALGDRPHSVQYAEKATQLAPARPVAWSNLGVVLDADGRFGDAEAAYRRSLELDSRQPATLLNLSTNLLVQQKPQEAVSVLQQLVRTDDSASARKRYGDALHLVKRDDEAASEYRMALTMNPRYYPALNGLADLLMVQYKTSLELDESKRQGAVDLWRRSLAIQPEQGTVVAMLKTFER
jgi:Flp pilus assembly protein TadD